MFVFDLTSSSLLFGDLKIAPHPDFAIWQSRGASVLETKGWTADSSIFKINLQTLNLTMNIKGSQFHSASAWFSIASDKEASWDDAVENEAKRGLYHQTIIDDLLYRSPAVRQSFRFDLYLDEKTYLHIISITPLN